MFDARFWLAISDSIVDYLVTIAVCTCRQSLSMPACLNVIKIALTALRMDSWCSRIRHIDIAKHQWGGWSSGQAHPMGSSSQVSCKSSRDSSGSGCTSSLIKTTVVPFGVVERDILSEESSMIE